MKGYFTGYFVISGAYPKDSWYFYDKEGQSPPALSHLPQAAQLTVCSQLLPHQWNLQNSRGKKKEEMWNSVYVTIQIYKNKLHFKAGNSHTHQSHCYLHTHQHHEGEGVSTGLSKRRTNLHSAPFTWLWRANSWNFNSKLFTLKSLLRHTTRNNLFFQEILIAKKPSLCKMEMTQRAPPLCQEKVP